MTFPCAAEVCEHRNDNHADSAAEPGFADPGEPCAEAKNDNFVDRAASFFARQV